MRNNANSGSAPGNRRRIVLALVLAAFMGSPPATASDLAAGKKKARMCAVCHGIDGIAKAPNAPNLAGEAAVYIMEQLLAFRSGKRTHEQMSIIAKGLNDSDIANLAAWYSAIKVTVELPKVD